MLKIKDGLRVGANTVIDQTGNLLTTAANAALLAGQPASFYQNASNLSAGTVPSGRMPGLTGDISSSAGAVATTLATVNSNVGSFGSATQSVALTVNAKGLVTAASSVTITPAWSSITSKPTTIAGYGLTDALSVTGTAANAALLNAQPGSYYTNASNITAGTLPAAQMPAHTGDVSSSAGSVALTLATVNGNVGTFGSATVAPIVTVNGKGLITTVSTATITPAWSSITSKPTTLSGYGITDAQPLNSTLSSVAGTTWTAGTQILSLTALNTISLKTVGSSSGNILDKGAGDALYLGIASTAANSALLSGQPGSFYTNASNMTAGTVAPARFPAFTGDITTTAGGIATTLATVNSNIGSFGSGTVAPVITVNAKGLVTAVTTATITPAWLSITSKPTTISGYGLTDALSITGTAANAALLNAQPGSFYTNATNINAGALAVAQGGTGATTTTGTGSNVLSASPTLTGTLSAAAIVATGTITGSNLSGTNTGDQTTITGNAGSATILQTGRTLAISGDLVWSSGTFNGSANVTAAGTLATVNANVGSFGSTSAVPIVTVNGKGLITAVSTAALGTAAVQNISTSGANVPLMSTNNTWSGTQTFTAPVLGTPASGNLTNCTFPTLNQNTTGSAATVAGTSIGQTGNATFFTTTGWTSTNWSNLAVGGGGTTTNNTPGAPGNSFYYFAKLGQRDTAGGWGGIAVGMDNTAWWGSTLDSSTNATWKQIAELASPNFSGTPAAPTATAGTNNGQIATTAFVQSAVAAAPYVSTSGGNITGTQLQIFNSSGAAYYALWAGSAYAALSRYGQGGNLRWEAGLVGGGDYNISRYSTAGAFQNTPVSIQSSTGNIYLTGATNVTGNATVTANLSVSGITTLSNGLNVTGTTTLTGNATVSGNLIGSQVFANAASSGSVNLTTGGSSHTGLVQFFNSSGTRQGYVGYATTGGALNYVTDTGGGHCFSGNIALGTATVQSTKLISGTINTSDAITYLVNEYTGSAVGGVVVSIGVPAGNANNTSSYHFAGVTQGVNLWYLYGNGSTSYSSDLTLKKNVKAARLGYLDDLRQLQVRKYDWRSAGEIEAQTLDPYSVEADYNPSEIGLIAQEVEQVFPGLVEDALHDLNGSSESDTPRTKVLKASVFTPILIKSIQELADQCDAQKAQIDALVARLDALEAA